MPKYLVTASYTQEGVAGVLAEGGSSRRDVVSAMIAGLGGRVESFYFAFGERDVYVILDAPDNEAVAAVALTVNAAGGAAVKTTVLLTPEQVDEARQRSVEYRPPGG